MQYAACRKICSKSSVIWTFEPRPLINVMRWSLNKGFHQGYNVLFSALNCRKNLQTRKLNCIWCFENKIWLISPALNVWNRCVREYPLPKSFISPYTLPWKSWTSISEENFCLNLFQKLTPRKLLTRPQIILCLEWIKCTFSRGKNKDGFILFYYFIF